VKSAAESCAEVHLKHCSVELGYGFCRSNMTWQPQTWKRFFVIDCAIAEFLCNAELLSPRICDISVKGLKVKVSLGLCPFQLWFNLLQLSWQIINVRQQKHDWAWCHGYTFLLVYMDLREQDVTL